MRDQARELLFKRAISPTRVTNANTAQVSQIIDRAGFDALTFVVLTGTLTDADMTTTVLVEDGEASNLSDAAAVADADLAGSEAGAAPIFSDDDKVLKIGYLGTKRYVRITVTPAANDVGNFDVACVAVLGSPTDPPYSTQKT